MKVATQPKKGTIVAGTQAQVEIKKTDVELMIRESEKIREQIYMKATEVGPILEALLRESHGQIRWGLNE
jgi:hypothetical protein